MRKNSGFYIDVDKMIRLGIIRQVKVTINGTPVKSVLSAKSGNNGFVEFLVRPLRRKGDCLVIRKIRGNVKITISKSK